MSDWRNLDPVAPDERPVIPDGWQPSQSFLALHDRCDRAAMLRLKFGGGAGSLEMNRGLVCHEVFARLTRHAVEQGEGRIDSPEIGKDFLLEYLDEHPEIQLSAPERDACRYMVANFCLGEYWDPEQVVAVETPLTLEVGGFKIIGHIDRAEIGASSVDVIDYKTGFAPPASEDRLPFQLEVYALLLAEGVFPDGLPLGGNAEHFRLRLVYPRHLNSGVLLTREFTITRPQLLDFKLDIEQQLRRLLEVNLGEGRWAATPGTVCRECPAPAACPLPRILREESQLADSNTREGLERMAAASWFMGERARTLKARVKKGAERLEAEDPEALDLGNGEQGIRIGRDLAFVFVGDERETIKDREALYAAIEAARQGEPFDYTDHFRRSESIRFERRKVTPKPTEG